MTATAAPTIFLLRGLVRESGHWLDYGKRLEEAIPGARVRHLDILGSGKHFRTPTPPSIPRIVERLRADAMEFLREPEAQGKPAMAFAISLGGMLMVEWMRRWPGDLARVVLGNTSLRGYAPMFDRLQPSQYPTIWKALREKDTLRRERMVLSIVSNRPELHDRIAPLWAEIHRARPVSTSSFFRQVFAAATYRPPTTPPPVPTLLLNGAGDRLVSPRCSLAIAKAWGLELRTSPIAGHDLTTDDPVWLTRQLVDWFTRT